MKPAAAAVPSEVGTLARKVMEFSRDCLMADLPYLNRAFFHMPFLADEDIASFGTNGKWIRYSSLCVISQARRDRGSCSRAFLHMVLHCLFRHPFESAERDPLLWNFSCDMAVENVILEMGLASTASDRDEEIEKFLGTAREKIGMLNADRICRYLMTHPEETQDFLSKEKLFFRDEHAFWHAEETESQGGRHNRKNVRAADMGCHDAEEKGEGEPGDQEGMAGKGGSEDWDKMGQEAVSNMESFVRGQGKGAGAMLMNLNAVNREKQDYSEFLKKFSMPDEELLINDDEFDYIYYTYGLKLYTDMPLIEPLEYRDENKIREFVVAIDTSCSCQGEMVKKFLEKTYSILKSGNEFFEKFNLHILQCDTVIHRDVKITTDAEFERYMGNVEIAGYGGTDFRPVFTHVDGLIRKGEFRHLKGLLYFTDCRGTFPESMPGYKTAFISIYEGKPIPKVPAWAIQMILQEDEVQ
jgi:hypothetical protein